MCLGVSPDNLYFGIWTKADVTTGKAGRLVSMEKNANASFKLTKTKAMLYPIADFETQLKSFTKKFKSNS
jgi:transposase-like protein